MSIAPEIEAAVHKMEDFVTDATGQPPSAKELSDAMTRYFVLKEMLEFIKMSRGESS